MARYIDADKAKEVFHRKTGGSSFDSFIDDVPTADVVEVVRCRNCLHGEIDDPVFPNQYFCAYTGCDWNNGSHFCGYAERRADNG